MQITFYQLTVSPFEKVLPKILEKICCEGKRAVILCDSEERVSFIDSFLWTYSKDEFLPHGTKKTPFKTHTRHPVWITCDFENPNNSEVLIVTNGFVLDSPCDFTRCLDLFDGKNSLSIEKAHERMSLYQKNAYECKYYYQAENGLWKEMKP
ncbi:MAG: DNA polymerase III subunit chi [Alphaproteobacteria bacterium]